MWIYLLTTPIRFSQIFIQSLAIWHNSHCSFRIYSTSSRISYNCLFLAQSTQVRVPNLYFGSIQYIPPLGSVRLQCSWWTWQSLRQSCPHWGVISSWSRPLWFSLWSAVSRVFCNLRDHNPPHQIDIWIWAGCWPAAAIIFASSRSRSTGEVKRSDQSIDTRTGHWTSIWTARDTRSFNSIS